MSITNATNSSKTTFHDEILIPYFFERFNSMDIEEFHNYTILIIFGVGSSLNILIIAYFVKINLANLRKMSSYHFLIINLAVVDFCASAGISFHYINLKNPT